jgi:hypothetical protein
MEVGILGSGDVGHALGNGFVSRGHMVKLGGIEGSRLLEPLCILWVGYGASTGTWNHAFKLLRK